MEVFETFWMVFESLSLSNMPPLKQVWNPFPLIKMAAQESTSSFLYQQNPRANIKRSRRLHQFSGYPPWCIAWLVKRTITVISRDSKLQRIEVFITSNQSFGFPVRVWNTPPSRETSRSEWKYSSMATLEKREEKENLIMAKTSITMWVYYEALI